MSDQLFASERVVLPLWASAVSRVEQSELLRQQALSVRDKIEGCMRENAMSAENCPHAIFAHLYWHSTKRWLAHLEAVDQPELAYLVIIRFFDLYYRYVRQSIYEKRQTEAPYWEPYFRVANKIGAKDAKAKRWRLLYFGVRAHVKFDLGYAIERAYQDHIDVFGQPPEQAVAEELLLGVETDRLFMRAASDFVRSEDSAHMFYANMISKLTDLGIRLGNPVWLLLFQRWRRAAWSRAQRSAAST